MIIDPEKKLADHFKSLARKTIPEGDRISVWLTVQNHLRQARLETPYNSQKKRLGFLLLRANLGKIVITLVMALIAMTLVRGVAKANPGETLYPVKKAAEQMEKVFATNDEAKVKVGIKHAKRRLEEVKTLVQTNKEIKIVSDTLDALNSTTQEIHEVVFSIGADKPELVDEALNLASEEEQILNSVETNASEGVKEAVQKVIVATKESIESITKLKASNDKEEVKGTAAIQQEDENTESASTSETVLNSIKKSGPKPKETIIESPVQIDGIIKVEGDNIAEPSDPAEPEIVPSP